MRTRVISVDEALTLSQREESHVFDRKAVQVAGRAIQKVVVAFANADGGELLIGIADDKDEPDPQKRWQGASKLENLNAHLQSMFEVRPSLDLRYEFLKCDPKPGYVLRVLIEKSQEVHRTADETVYQRYGAQSLPSKDPQRVMELSFAKGATSFEDQVLQDLQPEAIVDAQELHAFLMDHAPKTDPLDFVVNQNLIDNKTWGPRVASALLFHANPSSVMPRKCAVKIARYETKEDDPERDHLASQVTLEGPMYQLINCTIEKIKEIMSSVQIWTPEGLKYVDYPPEAIWEVVVNALIHRDYSISDDVQILIFDNRIDVLSPGRFPGYVTKDNILEARYSRNAKIVRTLNRYKNPPNKDLGEGLDTTFQKMKAWGLKEPSIDEENNYVRVTLSHTPLAAPSEAILEFLKHNPQITNRQARDVTGIRSENLVKVEFYKLRDNGLIEMIPELKGPRSAWRLTPQGRKQDGLPDGDSEPS
jgi:ATP-dependent DNA helicase RecG